MRSIKIIHNNIIQNIYKTLYNLIIIENPKGGHPMYLGQKLMLIGLIVAVVSAILLLVLLIVFKKTRKKMIKNIYEGMKDE